MINNFDFVLGMVVTVVIISMGIMSNEPLVAILLLMIIGALSLSGKE